MTWIPNTNIASLQQKELWMEHGQHGRFSANAPDLINCPSQDSQPVALALQMSKQPPSFPFRRSQIRRPGRGCATVSSDLDASVNVRSRVGTALEFASDPANVCSWPGAGRRCLSPFRLPGSISDAVAAYFLSRFDMIASVFRSAMAASGKR